MRRHGKQLAQRVARKDSMNGQLGALTRFTQPHRQIHRVEKPDTQLETEVPRAGAVQKLHVMPDVMADNYGIAPVVEEYFERLQLVKTVASLVSGNAVHCDRSQVVRLFDHELA